MSRLPRIDQPGYTQHVVQRGHNRDPIFFSREDYQLYLTCLEEAAQRYGCQVHAYVLMTNHVHLLVTPMQAQGLSRMMQLLNRRFVRSMNHSYGRSGTLWEGRYKANLIDAENYLLTCYRYIELNPVRAGMVDDPRDYPWSSYRYHAWADANTLIDDHEGYMALGKDAKFRCQTYRDLFKTALDPECLQEVRDSLNKGVALGNDRFKEQVEKRLGQRVRQAKRGRPKKKST